MKYEDIEKIEKANNICQNINSIKGFIDFLKRCRKGTSLMIRYEARNNMGEKGLMNMDISDNESMKSFQIEMLEKMIGEEKRELEKL
jgi:hypothetical protein